MLTKSLLCLFLGLLMSCAVSDVSARIVQRIVGGHHAQPGRFKHQVSLESWDYYSGTTGCALHFCGGSILDERHILTAAHCVADHSSFNFARITIVAGTRDLRNKSSGIYRDVDRIYLPPTYFLNAPQEENDDIALLRLRRPLPLGTDERIRAVNLPKFDQYKPPAKRLATMSGFGIYSQDKQGGQVVFGKMSPRLKYIVGRINESNDPPCTEKQVCVQTVTDQGPCKGDSGGPLTDESTNTLIGVASTKTRELCGTVTKYTRVSEYLDFINKAMAGMEYNGNLFKYIEYKDFKQEGIIEKVPYCHQVAEEEE
ncbi:chymotrypsin-1-like [Trichogramma pretiosum]|uniref:chymotrypsin-1-like n=1 Tax=Trichogramma pretiosum TaxID=7493 RepID=UPI0006C9896F|nr:chymotrypsin-1-like [Trichogramma pretiosum]